MYVQLAKVKCIHKFACQLQYMMLVFRLLEY